MNNKNNGSNTNLGINLGKMEKIERSEYTPPPRREEMKVEKSDMISDKKVESNKAQLQHPVIKRMYEKFGIDTKQVHRCLISDDSGNTIEFGLTQFPDELTSWALSESKKEARIKSEDEAMTYFQMLQMCLSIVCIDDIPVYELFSIPLYEKETDSVSINKYNISARVRRQTAPLLANMFLKDLKPFSDKIYTHFLKHVEDYRFEGPTDKENKSKVRYICPEENCGEHIFDIPLSSDRPYYCRIHGKEMIKGLTFSEESSFPLA